MDPCSVCVASNGVISIGVCIFLSFLLLLLLFFTFAIYTDYVDSAMSLVECVSVFVSTIQCFGYLCKCLCVFVCTSALVHIERDICTTHIQTTSTQTVCFSFIKKEYGTEPSIRIFIVCCIHVVVFYYIITFTYRHSTPAHSV